MQFQLLAVVTLFIVFVTVESSDYNRNRCDNNTINVIKSECTKCSTARSGRSCPEGFVKYGSVKRGCKYPPRNRRGCYARCKQVIREPKCCPLFYGPLCLACPSDFMDRVCSGHGSCDDGITASGRCTCNDGVHGDLCNQCNDTTRYGDNCAQQCSCVHGKCNSGVFGRGTCTCYNGFTGPMCDQRIPSCGATQCAAHERCVDNGGSSPVCQCEIGYYRNSTTSLCQEIHSCDSSDSNTCHKMAQCVNVAPAQYLCQCVDGYEGDGFFCRPVDKCLKDNGGCPNGTLCVYAGPNQVNCTCRQGYELKNGTCELTELCGSEPRYTCEGPSSCTTVDHKIYVDIVCKCIHPGLRLVGRKCYSYLSNELMAQSEKYNISSAIIRMFPYWIDTIMATDRSTTLLVPTNEAISKINLTGWTSPDYDAFARAHVVPTEVILDFVNGTAQTLTPILGYNSSGKALKPLNIGGQISPYTAILKWKQGGSCGVVSPVQYGYDGVFYVIDGVNMPSAAEMKRMKSPSNGDEKNFMSKISDVSIFRQLYTRYWSGMNPWAKHDTTEEALLANQCSPTGPFRCPPNFQPGPGGLQKRYPFHMLFIPTNAAIKEVISDEELQYLQTLEGREQLGVIIKANMVRKMQPREGVVGDMRNFGVYHFIRWRMETYGNAGDFPVDVSSHDGSIQISNQHARLVSASWNTGSNVSQNFIIVDRVIFPHYFDTIEKRICPRHLGSTKDICAACSEKNPCPDHHKLVGKHKEQCLVKHHEYQDIYRGHISFPEYGCKFTCADNVTTHECCPGFFGPACQRCPGPSGNPCYGQGICLDGKSGSGQCSCQTGMTGVDCRTCVDPNKFGDKCLQNCSCVHGTCDNRVDAPRGVCKVDTCEYMPTPHHNTTTNNNTTSQVMKRTTWLGENCDQPTSVCHVGELAAVCHHYAVCVVDVIHISHECTCLHGYRGDGIISCVPYDVCADITESGCHALATCNVSSTGAPQCTCAPGYRGDGKHCEEVNVCSQEPNGGCDANAVCIPSTDYRSKRCRCGREYRGNGYVCQKADPCDLNICGEYTTCTNGGGPHEYLQVNCTCLSGYKKVYGGLDCFATILARIVDDPTLSQIRGFYQDPEQREFRDFIQQIDRHDASGKDQFDYLFPNDEAWSRMSVEDYRFWTTPQHLPYLFKFLSTNGTVYNYYRATMRFIKFLTTEDSLTSSLKQEKIPVFTDTCTNFTYGYGDDTKVHCMPQFGKERANVASYLMLASKDYLLVIDQVLVPPRDVVQDFPSIISVMNSNETDSKLSNYRLYLKTLQHQGVMDMITNLSHYTIFAIPDDDFSPARYSTLQLKYNVIPSDIIRVSDVVNGKYYQSLAPSGYQVELTKADQTMYINQMAVVDADMRTERGVIHGLQYDLPEARKNRCSAQNSYLRKKCQSCRDRVCRGDPLGRVISRRPRGMGGRKCMYRDSRGRRKTDGCNVVCLYRSVAENCCPNFYGAECTPCPGGITTTCSGRGKCFDKAAGNGTCKCLDEKYTGLACDECATGLYGDDCELKCNCTANGVCVDGIHGTGACICKPGYMGARCEQVYDSDNDHCNGRCHSAALCLTHPSKLYTCECMNGYQGNGSHCEAVNPCKSTAPNAHKCHELAVCSYKSPGVYKCTCKENYEGDGTFCESINPCTKPGKESECPIDSTCHHTGPNKATCVCNDGYKDGHMGCVPIDPCEDDNGGCHEFAHCVQTGPNERSCKCLQMMEGDGFECVGNVIFEFILLGRTLHGMKFIKQVDAAFLRQLSVMVHDFVTLKGQLTMFVPDKFELLAQLPHKNRKTMDNHFVTCDALYNEDDGLLKTQVRTLAGQVLQLEAINKTAFLINGTITAYSPHKANNGWIFLMDQDMNNLTYLNDTKVLTTQEQILEYFGQLGASEFANLMKASSSLDLLDNPVHSAWTFLLPSDEAISKLPAYRKQQLLNVKGVLSETIRYHMIAQFSKKMVEYSVHPYSITTEQGSDVTIGCGKREITGTITVNEGEADVINFQRVGIQLHNPNKTTSQQKSTIMIIDSMLEAPSIGGRCDDRIYANTTEECGICWNDESPNVCEKGALVAVKKCHDDRNLFFKHMLGGTDSVYECEMICTHYNVSKKCCDDHYGASCLPCPGGVGNSCFGHGLCDAGISGSGECTCSEGFAGMACEFCAAARFGPNCSPCNCSLHGSCDDGLTGAGTCFCDEGYIGSDCSTSVANPATCGNNCSTHGVCSAELKTCICRPGYTGDGINCEAINKCTNSNPCSYHADCIPQGVNVTCKCKTGYIGDGYECRELAVGCEHGYPICHSQASCVLPSGGSGEHVCKCNQGYVGDGVIECKSNHEVWMCSKSCSQHAICTVIKHSVTCQCKPGFIGNGLVCVGDVSHVILQYEAWSNFMNFVYHARKDVLTIFQRQQNITVFIPIKDGEAVPTGNLDWHIILGQRLTMKDLVDGGDRVYKTYQGHDLHVQVASDNTVHVNGILVKNMNYLATNGIIHVIHGVIPRGYDKTQTVKPTTQPTTTTTTIPTTTTTTKVDNSNQQPATKETTNDNGEDVATTVQVQTTVAQSQQTTVPAATTSIPALDTSPTPLGNVNKPPSQGSSASPGAMVAIVVGIIVIIGVMIGLAYWKVMKNRNSFQPLRQESQTGTSNPIYDMTAFIDHASEQLQMEEFGNMLSGESES